MSQASNPASSPSNDPVEIMQREQAQLGRPCFLVASPQVISGEDEVMLVLYDCEPLDLDGIVLNERRWAVYVNGKHSGGGSVNP